MLSEFTFAGKSNPITERAWKDMGLHPEARDVWTLWRPLKLSIALNASGSWALNAYSHGCHRIVGQFASEVLAKEALTKLQLFH
jgi:hypothetical protein